MLSVQRSWLFNQGYAWIAPLGEHEYAMVSGRLPRHMCDEPVEEKRPTVWWIYNIKKKGQHELPVAASVAASATYCQDVS